jgi:hypothetical protein
MVAEWMYLGRIPRRFWVAIDDTAFCGEFDSGVFGFVPS